MSGRRDLSLQPFNIIGNILLLHIQMSYNSGYMPVQTIPPDIAKYFWDTDPAQVSIQDNKKYIIERLLEYGNEDSLHWVESTYSIQNVKEIIQASRFLSRKSAIFYSLYYQINPEDILCLQKDFLNKHRQIWQR